MTELQLGGVWHMRSVLIHKSIMLQPDISQKLLLELQQLQVDETKSSSQDGGNGVQNKP